MIQYRAKCKSCGHQDNYSEIELSHFTLCSIPPINCYTFICKKCTATNRYQEERQKPETINLVDQKGWK